MAKHRYLSCDVCGAIQSAEGDCYWTELIKTVAIRVPEDGINGGMINGGDGRGNADLCQNCRRVIHAAIMSAVKLLRKPAALGA